MQVTESQKMAKFLKELHESIKNEDIKYQKKFWQDLIEKLDVTVVRLGDDVDITLFEYGMSTGWRLGISGMGEAFKVLIKDMPPVKDGSYLYFFGMDEETIIFDIKEELNVECK